MSLATAAAAYISVLVEGKDVAVRRVVEEREAAKRRLMELVWGDESGGDILEERRWSKDGGRGV